MKQDLAVVTQGMKVRNLSVLFTMTLALAGFANAVTPSAEQHKVNIRHLEIKTPVKVGGALLPAGDYEVHEINTANGPELEFVHEYWNELASELVQANEEEVLARVQFTEQQLNSRAKHTQVVPITDNKDVIGLEIRGKNTEYLVEQSAPDMNAKADSSAGRTTSGQ
ncbi:MAG TPA: hypothetical protein VM578_05745 [Candidatus Saccharimonadales bacterium]|nr:hypothetical protein [Candidatus Saccharimonadales bacterium]